MVDELSINAGDTTTKGEATTSESANAGPKPRLQDLLLNELVAREIRETSGLECLKLAREVTESAVEPSRVQGALAALAFSTLVHLDETSDTVTVDLDLAKKITSGLLPDQPELE